MAQVFESLSLSWMIEFQSSGIIPDIAGIWGANKQMEDLSSSHTLSRSLSHSRSLTLFPPLVSPNLPLLFQINFNKYYLVSN